MNTVFFNSFIRLSIWILLCVFFCITRVTHAAGSVVTVDTNNALVINNKKVFPIGFSPGPPLNSTTPTGKDAMQELRDAGGLLYRMNQTTNWNSQVIADQQAILDWAAQHGMFVWVNLREVSQFATGDTNTAATLKTVVDTFRNHPALGLWKNFDEAWWSGISVTNLLNGYNVIKQEDTNHPVVQTHAPRGMVSDLQPYNVAADILAVDIYPVVASGSISNPPISNTQVSQIGDWTQELAQVANGQKEYWLIEQIAFSGTTPPAKTLVFPTFTQSRFMAYQTIINGARGLMFFGGNIAATLNAQDTPYGWNWTFWTNVLKPLVQQLGDNSLLANALVAPASSLPITFNGATSPDIEFCVREVPPYLYILASKREGATVNVTFSGLPSWAALGDVLYESPRIVSAQNGQFTDTFAQWDVHVYRFVQSNQPPVIITQPQSVTNTLGSTASFNVNAGGTLPLSYQWRKNTTNLSNAGTVSGTSSPTLTLSNVSSTDAASYDVIVMGIGSVTSSPPAILTVTNQSNQVPTIVSQPQSPLTNNAGSTATFNIVATGNNLSYQWFKNVSTKLTDGGNVSGSKTPSLKLSNVSSTDSASYTVTVSNSAGAQTSSSGSLSVIYPMPYFDPFNYAVGSNLGGNVNGNYLLWSDIGTSTAGPYVTLQSNSLSIPGLASATGNSIRFGALGKSTRFSFPPGNAIVSGTLYYSFALQVPDTNGVSPGGIFIAGFNNSVGTQANQPTVIGTRLYIHATNGGFCLGVSKASSTVTDWMWDPRTFTTNQVLFVVGSYAFDPSGNDVSKMWINPSPATFGTVTEPTTALVNSNGANISSAQIASFVFVQRATNQPALTFADELRIGTSWADVTPPSATISPVITGLTNLNGTIQFSYANTSGHSFTVYSSTNLVDWTSAGVATEVSPGSYQFTDRFNTGSIRRFYQLRSP